MFTHMKDLYVYILERRTAYGYWLLVPSEFDAVTMRFSIAHKFDYLRAARGHC